MTDEIKSRFTQHEVAENQITTMNKARELTLELALFMNEQSGESRETSLALTKLEEALMHFNAGVARNGTAEKSD